MGTTSLWSNYGLTEEQSDALNEIGYSGKYKGEEMNRNQYFEKFINNDKLSYSITLSKCDTGDFREEYILTKTIVY